MNRILFILIFMGLTLMARSQTTSVEKSIYGIQVGFLGIWGHNELRLSNSFALRSEIGFDLGEIDGSYYYDDQYAMAPVITIEPRWYYNLKKRKNKSRRIDGNSGNFVSIKTSYHPNWFIIPSKEGLQITPDISIVPTWGIRRNIGQHFNYEAGLGIGYLYKFLSDTNYYTNKSDTLVNLHLRIGYRF